MPDSGKIVGGTAVIMAVLITGSIVSDSFRHSVNSAMARLFCRLGGLECVINSESVAAAQFDDLVIHQDDWERPYPELYSALNSLKATGRWGLIEFDGRQIHRSVLEQRVRAIESAAANGWENIHPDDIQLLLVIQRLGQLILDETAPLVTPDTVANSAPPLGPPMNNLQARSAAMRI